MNLKKFNNDWHQLLLARSAKMHWYPDILNRCVYEAAGAGPLILKWLFDPQLFYAIRPYIFLECFCTLPELRSNMGRSIAVKAPKSRTQSGHNCSNKLNSFIPGRDERVFPMRQCLNVNNDWFIVASGSGGREVASVLDLKKLFVTLPPTRLHLFILVSNKSFVLVFDSQDIAVRLLSLEAGYGAEISECSKFTKTTGSHAS